LNVTDGKGGTSSDTVAINIVDTTPPALTCPADIAKKVGDSVALGTAAATDSVDPNPVISNNAPTSYPIGTTTVTWSAVDANNNQSFCQQKISVAYNFTGFFQPVDNVPTFNRVKAGRAIPIKFSLSGNQGLGILATGYPVTKKIACDTSAPNDDIEQTVTAGSSSLSYDATTDQYNYILKSDSAWASTCRQLVLRLKDGTDHVANFRFN
jgi:hypothetical protein